MFQFPSNGKAYLNLHQFGDGRSPHRRVSIPFKRESVSEHESLQEGGDYDCPTVSIPFKRESVSEPYIGPREPACMAKFQFPSNGKAYLNETETEGFNCHYANVSIPFKRESVSERSVKGLNTLRIYLCFNSLQTGKRI